MDLEKLAQSLSLDEYVARCPFAVLRPLAVPGPEEGAPSEAPSWDGGATKEVHVDLAAINALAAQSAAHAGAIAVRKTQSLFPAMITIGRTTNNDIVLPDPSVSRFHAYFIEDADGLVISDAGSTSGTFVGGKRLEPKGIPVNVPWGARLGVGAFTFSVLSAKMFWQALHA